MLYGETELFCHQLKFRSHVYLAWTKMSCPMGIGSAFFKNPDKDFLIASYTIFTMKNAVLDTISPGYLIYSGGFLDLGAFFPPQACENFFIFPSSTPRKEEHHLGPAQRWEKANIEKWLSLRLSGWHQPQGGRFTTFLHSFLSLIFSLSLPLSPPPPGPFGGIVIW